jgi:HEAT repeat protein
MKAARWLWFFVMWGAAAGLAGEPAAATAPSAEDIAKLIQQLNNEDFATREKAEGRLAEIGAPALPALKEALQSKEAEVSNRAARAIARIERPKTTLEGTLTAARETYENTAVLYDRGMCDIDGVYLWSCRWMEAQCAVGGKQPARIAAMEAHLARMQRLRDLVKPRFAAGQVTKKDVTAADYCCAEAERRLLLGLARE